MKGVGETMSELYRQPRVRMIVLAGIGVLLLIAIISALIYTAWQTGPVKTLFDAMDHARTSAGVYHVTMSDGSDFEIASDGVLIGLKGNVSGVPMEAVANGENVYVRSSSSKDLFAMFVANPEQLSRDNRYQEHVKLIDNQWFQINTKSLPPNSLVAALLSCGVGLRVNISDADNSKGELKDAYSFNQFVSTKSTYNTSNESTYKFMIDKDKLKSFFAHLVRTELGKKTSGCDAIYDRLGNAADAEFVITVTQPEHTFRGMQVIQGGREVIKVTADYSKKPTVEGINGGFDLLRMVEMYDNLPPLPTGSRP